MILRINNIVPIPLKEKLSARTSGIWNTNVSFTNNEHIKLKAPSGSGKTTLIHILYDLRRDFDGEVQINERSLLSLNRNEKALLRQQTISVVFQDLRLFPNLTARENIELKRVLQKPFYEKNVIDEMAVRLGVDHILDQRAGICSYGEQQRIAIIRALVQPFELLLMDEPFSHLDNNNANIAAALISEECDKRNAAFILTDLEDDDHFSYTQKLVL